MKFTLNAYLGMCIGACLTFTACNKDKTPEELLTGTTWKLVSSDYKDAGETTWTVEPIESCNIDDTFTFKNDVATIDAGTIKCDPTDPQTDSLPYILSEDGKTFTIDGEIFTVEKLDKSNFIIVNDDSGDLSRATFHAK